MISSPIKQFISGFGKVAAFAIGLPVVTGAIAFAGAKNTSFQPVNHVRDVRDDYFPYPGPEESQEIPKTNPLFHARIVFAPGSSNLSAENRLQLDQLIYDAHAFGGIDQTTIAAWSDKPEGSRALTPDDLALGKQRVDAISRYLSSSWNMSNIVAFNLAENSNWLARLLKANEGEINSIFSKRGAEAPLTEEELQLVRREGGKSSAVVIARDILMGSSQKSTN